MDQRRAGSKAQKGRATPSHREEIATSNHDNDSDNSWSIAKRRAWKGA
ncbi:hypothetical protein AKJ09_04919 [Labilithrix luteola]|uniref:Uncharacterized protein n=1 Tax=Labilithrix luteola TaxID=1391654 RepID=A0A0K1PXK3_9BACT|nr:hypothetical protein AKJ09_04919 [Labilithrix luteola]